MPAEPSNLLHFAERYTAAWCSHNPQSVAAFYAPSGSLAINNGAPAVGRSAITEAAKEFMAIFPDLQVLMDSFRVHGDRAVYHWTLLGTHTGSDGTRHRVRICGFEEWEFGADGLIAESRGHFDEADYQRQLERGFGA